MRSSVFQRAVADDARAAQKLDDVVRRARIRAGTQAPLWQRPARAQAVPLSRFPGDRLLFSLVAVVLVTGTYVSLVHLMAPGLASLESLRWIFGVVTVVVAAAVWQLGSGRQLPTYHPDVLPDASTDRPLEELHDFAISVASTLSRDAARQWVSAAIVWTALSAVLVWSGMLIARGYWPFARVLGPSALLMASFLLRNWSPRRWIQTKRALAFEALGRAAQLQSLIRAPDRERRSVEDDWEAAQAFLS